jgi:hypothetical protein
VGGRHGGKTIPISASVLRRARTVLANINVAEAVPQENREKAVRVIAEILSMATARAAQKRRRPSR